MTDTDFEKTMLQQISDVAWLVRQGDKRLGILNQNVQERYTYINGSDFITFKNKSEVIKHFGNTALFNNKVDKPVCVQDTFFVKGHEIDYPQPFVVDNNHPDYRDDLPLYTKIENSDVYYAAGYYCINFSMGWKHARGPKLTTLLKYGYEGPFKTEIEMKQRIKVLNKIRKNTQKIS